MSDYSHLIEKIEFEEGIYEGQVNEKGQRHGLGSYNFLDGERYEGEWRNGHMHGQGTFYESDGAKYVG